ncbi:minichromosome maintenance 10 [Trichoderma cornu-damae]|uniref:Minichromosome maintenance 10 n=1 Tax=Trichoderma cornu-damae TaxID=654480 RepID=A0A9P8TXY4_9HYPO|nr:minichromosome maintenance 10 [Trichoderma cornu-damae]
MAHGPGPQEPEASWPPRSPHEALMSTPKGRQRYREMMNQTSPTPSPSRNSRALASVMARSGALQEQMDDDDDDDEETLQLKLQEIQARLKLKRLQKAKESAAQGRPEGRHSRSNSLPSGIQPRRAVRGTTPTPDNPRPSSQSAVQVPASPVRTAQGALSDPKSPSRVLLGIDKGLRAKDVSLKRAPSFRKTAGNDAAAHRGYLQRSKAASPPGARSPEGLRAPSFNERLASARSEEVSRAERQERISRLRSTAFGIGKEEMEEYKKNAVDIPDEPLQAPSFSRDEVLGKQKPAAGALQQTGTVPDLRNAAAKDNDAAFAAAAEAAASSSSFQGRKNSLPASDVSTEEQGAFEPYSSIHLSKRILPHRVVARHISGKKIFNVKDLLREVKAPDFALPDVEEDIVVFAIVAKKSEPRAHKPAAGKNGQKTEDRGKYMVLTLVDLEYELDLFLFNSGFTRYWKLTEGTVVAILNPTVMPPPPGRQDTGRFSLVINSDEDTILEIGSARDLGFCQSIKKDGDMCRSWVNKKRTQYCEFHSNEAIRKQRATRMEVNASGFGARARLKGKGPAAEASEPAKKKADNYDWETKTHWYVSRGHAAADLIDGKDRDPSDRKDKADFLRRSMEVKEKEREMMKKLGQIGSAAGKEYMQRSGSRADTGPAPSSMSSSQQQLFGSADPFTEPERPDAGSLGLLDKARDIHLSPVKRKRTGSSQTGSITRSSSSNSNSTTHSRPSGLGWGGALKEKLSSMKDGEKLKPEQPPLRKKTRFVTEKGIREAGRESLGNLAERNLADRQVTLQDDDDDELVIVR